MKYVGIKKFDIENGLGIGLTLFTQGCTKNCSGCHNPSTHDFNGGIDFTEETMNELLYFFECNPQVKRLTLSGGDPLENLDMIEHIIYKVKSKFPYLKIWVYTGFTFEFLIKNDKYSKVLSMCDILIDGKFEIDNRRPNLAYRGSSNQRIIDVQKSLKENKIILLTL